MQQWYSVIGRCPLFAGIEPERLGEALDCLSARAGRYERSAWIFPAGSRPAHIGMVLSGSVYVTQEDYWGGRLILSHLTPAELFGEAFACAGADALPVGVVAAEPSQVLLLDFRRVTDMEMSGCGSHARLTANMLRILAHKNVFLTRRLDCLSRRHVRDRLLAYLTGQARAAGSRRFRIPFGHQDLADYLCVNRAALSRELSAMRREGLIDYHGQTYTLPEL